MNPRDASPSSSTDPQPIDVPQQSPLPYMLVTFVLPVGLLLVYLMVT